MTFNLKYVAALAIVSATLISSAFAQPRFEVPLTVSDGLISQTLYFGILPVAHYCIDPSDSLHGHVEEFLPPPPPGGIFDARMTWPRSGSNLACFDQGSLCDFRPFTSSTQKDTFRVKMQIGDGTTKTISWPAILSFQNPTLRYFDAVLGANVNVNMLAVRFVNFTDTDDPATLNIYSGPTTSVQVATLPGEFALHQNYPNPFNPSTRIVYRVASREFVSLKVFNLLGQEVATLVDGRQEQGEHSVEWKPEGLSSGVYIYRLTTASATVSKKMFLLR